jgi:hypothetical protein
MRRLVILAVCLSLTSGASCTAFRRESHDDAHRHPDLTLEEVVHLRQKHNYFALRDRLREAPATRAAAADVARATVQAAFNHPAASNLTIRRLLETGALPDSLVADLRLLAMDNSLRLFEYTDGLKVANTLLADTTRLDARRLRDARNTQRVFQALARVPPQTVQMGGPSRILFVNGRVPVTINDSTREYGFDTGANLSGIMRSEAAALGVRVIPAGIELGTATDRRIVADLGVVDRLTIGEMHFRNVVVLVLDDAMLTFADGFRIPGIIGFPVIEQMGEIHLTGITELRVPVSAPRRPQANLALDGLSLLTPVRWEGETLLCRLDTGAGQTQFYEPFYRRFRAQVDASSVSLVRKKGGAGGVQETPVRVLADMRLALGDTVVVSKQLDVVLQPLVPNVEDNYLDCNIGRDLLGAYSELVLNFREMAFILR